MRCPELPRGAPACLWAAREPRHLRGSKNQRCVPFEVRTRRTSPQLSSSLRPYKMPELRHYVGPDWPLHRAAYAYVLNLCPSDLAWEFLRRNPAYQRDYQLSRRGPDHPCSIGRGRWLTRLRRCPPQYERWGLCPLVDPKCRAPQAAL